MLRRSPAPEEIDAWVLGLSSQSVSPYAVTRAFVESDECQRMNRVKTYAAPGHFYSPIVNPAEGHARLVRAEAEAFSDSLPGLEINRGLMIDTWNRLLPFLTDAPFESSPGKGLKFGYDNPAYSWGDASVLHAMLRLYRPNRIVEIGCGWSSACIFDTVSRYLDPTCELTFIEPFPQLLRELLNNVTPNTRIFESKVQETAPRQFEKLRAGDLLFIDSSHILRTGSDVHFELFEILPLLAEGVLVHIHDIFWPFEYPRPWVVDENRSWNEAYAIRAFLTNNNKWRVLFFNDYFVRFERPRIEATFPKFLQNSGGALWIRRES